MTEKWRKTKTGETHFCVAYRSEKPDCFVAMLLAMTKNERRCKQTEGFSAFPTVKTRRERSLSRPYGRRKKTSKIWRKDGRAWQAAEISTNKKGTHFCVPYQWKGGNVPYPAPTAGQRRPAKCGERTGGLGKSPLEKGKNDQSECVTQTQNILRMKRLCARLREKKAVCRRRSIC